MLSLVGRLFNNVSSFGLLSGTVVLWAFGFSTLGIWAMGQNIDAAEVAAAASFNTDYSYDQNDLAGEETQETQCQIAEEVPLLNPAHTKFLGGSYAQTSYVVPIVSNMHIAGRLYEFPEY